MSPKQTFQAVSDSSVAKASVGALLLVVVGLGGWNLKETNENTGAIKDEATARVLGDGEIKERLGRIETNTERILEAQRAWP